MEKELKSKYAKLAVELDLSFSQLVRYALRRVADGVEDLRTIEKRNRNQIDGRDMSGWSGIKKRGQDCNPDPEYHLTTHQMSLSDTKLDLARKLPPVNRIRLARNYHTFDGGYCHWLATIMHLRGISQIYRYQQSAYTLPQLLLYVICVVYGCWVVACDLCASFVAVLLDFMGWSSRHVVSGK